MSTPSLRCSQSLRAAVARAPGWEKLHCGTAFIASLFDDSVRQDVWGIDSGSAISGSMKGAESNTARATADGVTINGEWHYASGIRHAQWVVCKVVVDEDAGGRPDSLIALIPTSRDLDQGRLEYGRHAGHWELQFRSR